MVQAAGWSGSRLLLKRLRDVMAGSGAAQARLDQTVRLIAADMVAEVCSAYLLRAGEVLELFATEGLAKEAVHQTRLRVGEGLVGDIAAHVRPLALSDAWTHPSFVYRPETGEDIYRSLMGVPIQRGGHLLGVLVVQNRTMRLYTEEEVETLETVAMVLAEMVASGELVDPSEASSALAAGVISPQRIDGVRLNGGLAIGQAVLHSPRITIRQMVAENPAQEMTRIRDAMTGMHSALDNLLAAEDLAPSGEFREVLESYRMFAEDRGWMARIGEAVRGGLTAEAAVQKVQNDMRARLRETTDPYLRERLHDLEDLTNRLLVHLTGEQTVPETLPDDIIVVARAMGPAELLEYDRRRLRGLVLQEGSPTSHVAIVARALDIPVIGHATDVLDRVEWGDPLLVDGDHALVLIRPNEQAVQSARLHLSRRAEQRATYAALKSLPATTNDGVAVRLMLNAGLPIDVAHLEDTGAAGVGLFRTEIPFMLRTRYPEVATQAAIYREVLDIAAGKPVVFRTLDIGGDKQLSYFAAGSGENPAMGWRAIRISLDRPAMLRDQLRALIIAANGRSFGLMFPMIAEIDEFDRARAILDKELARAERKGMKRPAELTVGAMLEVPALIWQLDALLQRADFLSVGSNDLIQFLFAADRGSPEVGERYDVLSPPVLACLKQIVDRARAASVPLTLCGEMAGRPLEAMALIGLGFRSMSMSPAAIGPVKAMTRSLEAKSLEPFVERLIGLTSHSIREQLRAFARDRKVAV
jgi:phosphotransferase system enzyme I (PtsP)